jgi:hypothetical protein
MKNNSARVREEHMQHLDEGTIHAWLDGALSADDAARAGAHVATCRACADAVAEARGLIAASSRILTALDAVPNVSRARSGGIAKGGRRSLGTWLVRERIAAVVSLVVAGGALALVMSRQAAERPQAVVALESAPVALSASDSPAPPPAPEIQSSAEEKTARRDEVRIARTPATAPATVGGGRGAATASPPSLLQEGPVVAADAATAAGTPTDDTVRSVVVAQGYREEARDLSAQAAPSVAEKAVAGLSRRRAAEQPARYAEPRATAPTVGAAAGAAVPEAPPRLVQEETMVESGRDVRRRIYRVDELLVTLDERAPRPALNEARADSANASLTDSTTVNRAIRWTDARGTEFTLTGPAPAERLERIRKRLGY